MIHIQKIFKKKKKDRYAKRVLFYVSFISLYLINITKILLFYHLNRIRVKLIFILLVTQNNKNIIISF